MTLQVLSNCGGLASSEFSSPDLALFTRSVFPVYTATDTLFGYTRALDLGSFVQLNLLVNVGLVPRQLVFSEQNYQALNPKGLLSASFGVTALFPVGQVIGPASLGDTGVRGPVRILREGSAAVVVDFFDVLFWDHQLKFGFGPDVINFRSDTSTKFGRLNIESSRKQAFVKGFDSVEFGVDPRIFPANTYLNFRGVYTPEEPVYFIFGGQRLLPIYGKELTKFGALEFLLSPEVRVDGFVSGRFGRPRLTPWSNENIEFSFDYVAPSSPVQMFWPGITRSIRHFWTQDTTFGSFAAELEYKLISVTGWIGTSFGTHDVTLGVFRPTFSGLSSFQSGDLILSSSNTAFFSGFDSLTVSNASLDEQSQVAQVFGFLAGTFGFNRVKIDQFVYPYGQRQTVFSLDWTITQTGPRRVWPASYYLPNMPLSTRVWNAQQFVRFETAFNKWFDEFGEETIVEYLLPKEPKFTGTNFTEFAEDGLFISHRIRTVKPGFIYSNPFGTANFSIRQFVDIPWSIHTTYGLPKVIRYLEALPDGYTMTEFGKWAWTFSNWIGLGLGFEDSVHSVHDVKRGLEYIRFGEYAEFTEFSPASVWNSTQYIFYEDIDEANDLLETSEATFVWNKNLEVRVPGFMSFASKPWLHEVYNNAVQFPTESIVSLTFGEKTFVAPRIRSLPLPSFLPTTYPEGNTYVWNYAFLVAPETIIKDGAIGDHEVIDTTQWLTFRNYTLPLEFGRPFVADRIRYVHIQQHPEDPNSKFSVPLVGLLEQYIVPDGIGENPPVIWPNIGWATIEELPPRYIGANPLRPFFEVEHYGLFGIKNVNRAFQWFAHYQPYPGFPTVELHTRYIEAAWDKRNSFGSTTRVSDRTQIVKFLAGLNSLSPSKIMTRLDRVPNDPPRTEQIVYMEGWTEVCDKPECPMKFGDALVRGMVIFMDSEDGLYTRFGLPDFTTQAIGIRAYKDFLEMGYYGSVTHRHRKLLMSSHMSGYSPWSGEPIGQGYSSTFSDRPARIDPRWVFMRNELELLPYDYFDEEGQVWYAVDTRVGSHGYGKGPGKPAVRLKNRSLLFQGAGPVKCGTTNTNCFGDWRLGTNPQYVLVNEGISSLVRGQLVIIPHKKRVFFQGFISTLYGEPTLEQEYIAPGPRTITMSGLDSLVIGDLDPQKWIRELYFQGHIDTGETDPGKYPLPYLWGKNNPMVYHYPRGFVTQGSEKTQHGVTWLSHNPRYYVLTGGDQTLFDWEDFRLKMTVTRGRGKITFSGFDSLSMGYPGNELGTRYVRPYMIAPPCVIGLNLISND